MCSYWKQGRRATRRIEDGIKAGTARGSFGETWCGRMWSQILEDRIPPSRLSAGRAFARKGQVASIEIRRGNVHARVQGERASPYVVKIRISAYTKAQWRKVALRIRAHAAAAAGIMAGSVDSRIEEAFSGEGISLFPRLDSDLVLTCSCAERATPCRHSAAVHFLIAEEIDRDPFILFRMRGMERDVLASLLSGKKRPAIPKEDEPGGAEDRKEVGHGRVNFWGFSPPGAGPEHEIRIPETHAALPRRLGRFPFWKGTRDLLKTLEPLYMKASEAAMEVLADRETRGGRPPKGKE